MQEVEITLSTYDLSDTNTYIGINKEETDDDKYNLIFFSTEIPSDNESDGVMVILTEKQIEQLVYKWFQYTGRVGPVDSEARTI